MQDRKFYKKYIVVDLDNMKVEIQEISIEDKIYGTFQAKEYLEELVNKSEEKQAIIITNGAFTSSNLALAGRYNIVYKNSQDKQISTSNTGGLFGRRLSYAGFEAIVVMGEAKNPTSIVVDKQTVNLVDAESFWGKTSSQLDQDLRNKYGDDSSSIYIGPSGENQSYLSCLINDKRRASGRDGLGALFGQKRLKSITVVSNNTCSHDTASMLQRLDHNYSNENSDKEMLRKIIESLGKDISQTSFKERENRAEEMNINPLCYPCPIMCPRGLARKEQAGKHKYYWKFKSPDKDKYNEIANKLANDYGIDAIGLVNYINHSIDQRKTDNLNWENPDTIMDIIEKSANDKEEIIQINQSLSNESISKEIKSTSEKIKSKDELSEVIDSLGLCIFSHDKLNLDDYLLLYNSATGNNITKEML